MPPSEVGMKEDDENTVHNRPGLEPDIPVTPLLSETAAWVADGCHGYVRLGASELSKRTGRSPPELPFRKRPRPCQNALLVAGSVARQDDDGGAVGQVRLERPG